MKSATPKKVVTTPKKTISREKIDYTKFNVKIEQWDYDRFSKLKPVCINRETEMRLAKVIKTLAKKYLPTHSVFYVGKAVSDFSQYKKGDYFRMDGNTRADVYKLRPDLIPMIPFNAIVMEFDNYQDVKDTYYSIDSIDAVEKGSDKMTGLLRERKYNAHSKKFKEGKFKRAVEIACTYGTNERGVYMQEAPIGDQLDFYWKEIKLLDKHNLDVMGRKYSSNIIGCLLMVAKKYGVTNPRLSVMLENLKNGISTTNTQNSVDGVHYVMYDLYEQESRVWNMGSYGAKYLVAKMLYGFDKFMKKQNLKKEKRKVVLPTDKELHEHMQFYNERVKK